MLAASARFCGAFSAPKILAPNKGVLLLIMAKKSYYAVVKGKQPGIYTTWEECCQQVNKFPGNLYQGFQSESDAIKFLKDHGAEQSSRVSRATHSAKKPRTRATHGNQSSPEVVSAVPDLHCVVGGNSLECAKHSSQRVSEIAEDMLRLEFDGASKGNPGKAGFGAVLFHNETNVEVARICQYMGSTHTNNQAEYAGLIAGLKAAHELGCCHIKIRGDSTLVINQVLGMYRVKNEGLKPYHAAAVSLLQRFKSFEAQQVPRERNKVADALSNEAITNYFSGVNPDIWSLSSCMKEVAAVPGFTDDIASAEEQPDGKAADTKCSNDRKRKSHDTIK